MGRPDFLDVLRPYGDQWLDLLNAYREQVKALPGVELAALDRAVNSVTTTNIGWTSYEAAQILREVIRDERNRRAAQTEVVRVESLDLDLPAPSDRVLGSERQS